MSGCTPVRRATDRVCSGQRSVLDNQGFIAPLRKITQQFQPIEAVGLGRQADRNHVVRLADGCKS